MTISVTLDWQEAERGSLAIWGYEVRLTDSGWGTGYLYLGAATACQIPGSLLNPGSNTFYIRAIDTNNTYSDTTEYVYLLPDPDTPTSLNYRFADTSLTNASITLEWAEVNPAVGLKHYLVTYGAHSTTTKSTTITLPADWPGDRTFSVSAVNSLDLVSTPRTRTVSLLPPGHISDFRAQVVDNNVLLSWTTPPITSLPTAHIRLKRGAPGGTWETATDLGNKSGSFTSVFETQGGTVVYWAAVVDTENHEGAPVSIGVRVNEPPDYVFNGSLTSHLTGTLSEAVISDGSVIFPVNTTETFESHFSSRSWVGPQEQVAGGYPIYIQPGAGVGYYEETFDFVSVLASSKATVSLSGEALSGNPTKAVSISLSPDGTSWAEHAGTEVFGTNFRYVKVRITVSGNGADLYRLASLSVRLDAKVKSSDGYVAAVSTDTAGTVANFNVVLVDVSSITLSPQGTTPITAVYDFFDSNVVGTYSLVSNIATVSATAHSLIEGQRVKLQFLSGTAPSGVYTVASVIDANNYTVAIPNSNTSGNVSTYPQGFRVYLFNSTGTRVSGTVSYVVKGY